LIFQLSFFEQRHIWLDRSNLALLKSLLQLSEVEVALLMLANEIEFDQSKLSDSSEACDFALRKFDLLKRLSWRTSLERNTQVAVVLGVSTKEASFLFGAPNSLVALHFLDGHCWHTAGSIADLATASEKLIKLLSTDYMSREALLADLVVQPFDWPAFPDPDITDVGYYEELPLEVAAVCVASNASLPLTAPQLVSAIWWQTCLRLPLEAVQPLDRRLELEAVSKAVSSAVVACRRANRMPADFDILKAIYTAA
jgi:hypothetical protein